jgi:hypothetical protein
MKVKVTAKAIKPFCEGEFGCDTRHADTARRLILDFPHDVGGV